MHLSFQYVLAAVLMTGAGTASACQSQVPVVMVEYLLREQLPERIEEALTNPLERLLVKLPRVAEMNSVTRQGAVAFEIQFTDGADERDLAAVKQRIAEIVLDKPVDIISTRVELKTTCLNTWPFLRE